jgi:Transposase DDE domain
VEGAVREQMRHKLNTPEGQAIYKMRKAIVEPVFGQIKEGRGFRRFSFRGLAQVGAEWTLICLTHNLLKLFRGRTGLLAA